MCKRVIIFAVILFFTLNINAQEGDRDIDLRVGLGFLKLKEGNALLAASEYEFNAKLSDYFTVAPSIALSIADKSMGDSEKLFQANLNAFVSPFRNNRRNDFRIGGGLSFYKFNQPAIRSAFGVNLIIEDSYMINNRFFIGAKAFMQPYFNKQLSYGILLKVGVNL